MTEGVGPADRGRRPDSAGTRSQTLDRGIRVLEALRDAQAPMAIAELARSLGVHRSIVYRILRTLEDHRLVSRTADGAYELGLGLPILARGVRHDLQSAALPVLSLLANDLGRTAFLVVPSGNEAITLLTVEPRQSVAHIAYAPGMRHPLDRGAPGLAVLAAWPPRPDERPEVAEVRCRGWAYSRSEVLPGMSAVAAPIHSAAVVASVATVYLETPVPGGRSRQELGERVLAAAKEIMVDLP
ncbi:DNA-binding IclR family transcriptional regulator [Spinactinospora alkalitolerans]|uniref:DNA-binding IclR family transcriptional regulator n=1 Tax=Spinactinospora alkalitolerans TaxID=687207 RepID=A0A852TTS4_9ACTN|nr:helix-turn-helix domain-containing protein [Spinactinospora alkalitolerans]NYE46153.1 DNA-binding IclR family transcriptional regulator [Spinactinospora alkalitolerans]